MPDKPLNPDVSLWINYMRELKRKHSFLEHISRKEGYPLMSISYKEWKNKYEGSNKTKKELLKTMGPFIDKNTHLIKDVKGGYKKGYKYPANKHWTAILKELIKKENYKGTWKEAIEKLYKPYIYSNRKATKLI